MKDRLPLYESGWRRTDVGILLQINLLPRAPVSVGIIDIAAAREKFDTAFAAELGASPLRENLRVEYVALVGTV